MDKKFPKIDPEFYLERYGKLFEHMRTQYTPPMSEERINNHRLGRFFAIKFMQENNLLVNKTIETPEQVESLDIQAKDLTDEGLEFFRTTYQNYIKALDRGTDAEKSKKNILDEWLA